MTPTHFTVDEVAPGVHACLDAGTGAAVSNAAIIDCGDKAIVFDAFNSTTASAELRTAVTDLTGKSAFLVVNSHWHPDHYWGNQEFSGTPIVGTRRMMELMVSAAPTDLDAWTAQLDAQLEALQEQAQSDDAKTRTLAERRMGMIAPVREMAPGFRLTLPDILIDERLEIEGERTVEIVTEGGGHTESDVFAWVPDARTIVTGDLVWNGVHPKTEHGDLASWAAIDRLLLELGPEQVVPGHGEAAGPEIIEAFVPYLDGVAGMVAELREDPSLDPAAMALPAGSEEWSNRVLLRGGLSALSGRS